MFVGDDRQWLMVSLRKLPENDHLKFGLQQLLESDRRRLTENNLWEKW